MNRITVAVAVVAATLALSACGGSTASPATTPTTHTQTVAKVPAPCPSGMVRGHGYGYYICVPAVDNSPTVPAPPVTSTDWWCTQSGDGSGISSNDSDPTDRQNVDPSTPTMTEQRAIQEFIDSGDTAGNPPGPITCTPGQPPATPPPAPPTVAECERLLSMVDPSFPASSSDYVTVGCVSVTGPIS